MVFSSITFIFYFLPIILIIYYIAPKKCKNIVLLIASLIFYFLGEPKYLLVMLISIISVYIHGLLINRYKKTKKAKFFLISGITISIGLLIYFKYINFFIKNIILLFNTKIDFLNIALPIGISFYTFQMISYIVDVYNEKVKVQKNFFTLATYVSLFPQLIAGPIVRYATVEEQLKTRIHSYEKFACGVKRFVFGLAKKVLIANVLGELINIFEYSNEKSVLFYWMYGIGNMLQIYFDFSGYSDMAIGIGKMFGFEFSENFNYPYIANSITDFWKRWHISLSTWFKDYIYIPLGGNRVKKLKWIRNIFTVWILTGLWHGADWNFVLWGLFFGVILILEKLILLKVLEKLPKTIKHCYVLFVVMISFIIFSSTNLQTILENIYRLFGLKNTLVISAESIYYLRSYAVIFIIAIIGATPLCKFVIEKVKKENEEIVNIFEVIYIMVLLILSISYIVDSSFNPFLYFRF